MEKKDQKKEKKSVSFGIGGIDLTKYFFIPGLSGLLPKKKKSR
jgi:hypothetical protein